MIFHSIIHKIIYYHFKELILKKEQLVRAGENQIIEEYKNNLSAYLNERLDIIATHLATMQEVEGLSSIEINEMIRPHNLIGQPVKYTTEKFRALYNRAITNSIRIL